MRVVVFIGYLFFLLLGGGHNFHASSQNSVVSTFSTHKLSLNHSVNYTNKDESNLLIEDTDFDLEEEHLTGEEVHNTAHPKSLSSRDLWPFNFCYAITGLSIAHHCKNATVLAQPSQGTRAPIYLKNKVLRI
jgi:hypothetical protein